MSLSTLPILKSTPICRGRMCSNVLQLVVEGQADVVLDCADFGLNNICVFAVFLRITEETFTCQDG